MSVDESRDLSEGLDCIYFSSLHIQLKSVYKEDEELSKLSNIVLLPHPQASRTYCYKVVTTIPVIKPF